VSSYRFYQFLLSIFRVTQKLNFDEVMKNILQKKLNEKTIQEFMIDERVDL